MERAWFNLQYQKKKNCTEIQLKAKQNRKEKLNVSHKLSIRVDRMASSVDTKFTTFPVALLFPSKWLNSKAALCDMLSSGFI